MDNEAPVDVVVVLKTGQRMSFKCFAFERVAGGYEFIDYPEQRGFKTIQLVRDDSVAALKITAPEHMMKALEMPPPAPLYAAGDPRVAAGPRTTLSAFNQLRAGARPIPDREAPPGMGRPQAAVTEFDEKGNAREIPVGAAMIGSGT